MSETMETIPTLELALVGSRYFGTAREDSDTDYVAPSYMYEELLKEGFQVISQARTEDSNLRAVMRRGKEEVLLMRSPQTVAYVSWLMNKHHFGSLLTNKKFALHLWTFVYELVSASKEGKR